MAAAPNLRPLRRDDFAAVAELARDIWLGHYTAIASTAQIEYMVAQRMAAGTLQGYLDAGDRWMDLLQVDDALVGYCSHALTGRPAEMKLEQLYVSAGMRGRGFGSFMLRHVEAHARSLGCRVLMLQVNKRNTTALDVYRASGFTIPEAVVIDIGQGFVMDDYVMEKPLRAS